VLTRQAVEDVTTGLIALASLGLLWRYKVPEPVIVALAAVAGLLLAS
jgi:chromate transporter